MNKYTGKSVFGGIAIGKIMVYEKGEHQVKRVKITDAEAEKNRYYEAVEIAFKQLGELHDKALREVGEANAAIFEIHQMMLEDDDYKESVVNPIAIISIRWSVFIQIAFVIKSNIIISLIEYYYMFIVSSISIT